MADIHDGHTHHVATSPPTPCPSCGRTHDPLSMLLVARAARDERLQVFRPTTAMHTAGVALLVLAAIGLWSVLAALWRTLSWLWSLI